MNATVSIADGLRHRDVECSVRCGMQGYGSVEIEVSETGLFTEHRAEDGLKWSVLDQVVDHPRVLGVTFYGPPSLSVVRST